MKTKRKFLKKVIMLIITITLSIFQVHAQTTSGSGGLTNNCATQAGTGGINSTLIGCGAGANNCGFANTFIGNYAGYNNVSDSSNVAVGHKALFTQTGVPCGSVPIYPTYNVAIGNYSLFTTNSTSSTNGIKNTAIGYSALYSNTTGYNNTASGFNAGYTNTTGIDNTFMGYKAGYLNSSGGGNSFFGREAGVYLHGRREHFSWIKSRLY